jgi:hypothetical protein
MIDVEEQRLRDAVVDAALALGTAVDGSTRRDDDFNLAFAVLALRNYLRHK